MTNKVNVTSGFDSRWETEPDYCSKVKRTAPYDNGTRLVDFVDMAILDFLMSRFTINSIHRCLKKLQ